MTNKCKCGGRVYRQGWRFNYNTRLYVMTINDGYAHFKCNRCSRQYKQKLRTRKTK